MSTPVEQAATAMYDAFWQAMRDSDDPFGYFDEDMGKIDGAIPPGTFRRMAEAAIEALQLTEETAFKYTHLASGRFTILDTTDVPMARKIAGTTHELAEVSRLVGPWRTAEENQ